MRVKKRSPHATIVRVVATRNFEGDGGPLEFTYCSGKNATASAVLLVARFGRLVNQWTKRAVQHWDQLKSTKVLHRNSEESTTSAGDNVRMFHTVRGYCRGWSPWQVAECPVAVRA